MNNFKRIWSVIFGVSSKEFAGFRIIVFTAIICSVGLVIANEVTKSPYDNYQEDSQHLDSLLAIMEAYEKPLNRNKQPVVLRVFNPNKASSEELMQLGLPRWLANRLVNYRNAGGRFKQPRDLLKIYNFPDSLYQQLENYIVIDEPNILASSVKVDKRKLNKPINITKTKEILPVFDINKADTAMLQTIKGIGSKFSGRIVDYRGSLGGFITEDQFYEIYHLDSSVVEKLKNKSVVSDDFVPRKMEINRMNKAQLANHPYISWNQAKLIIAYRNQHGFFNTEQDLLNVYSINENWVKKIAPYLSFQ